MIKHLTNILKTNVAACTSIGHPFVIQLSKLYLDLLNLYKCISEMISNSIARNGEQVTKTQLIRSQRAVKKETLKLIETWISKSEDPQLVVENFVGPLLEAVLGDYVRTIPQARDPEVLSCMTAVVRKLQEHITEQVPVIFEAVFAVTLDMINKDLAEYPEHRAQFFGLLDAINDHCFQAFFAIPADQFKLVIDSIVWAMKHTMRNVNETGLTILHNMLVNMSGHGAAQDFYRIFYASLLEHIFAVVSDPAHQSGFKQICDILALMIALVEGGEIKVPLGPDAAMANAVFVRQFLATLLQSAFPNLQPDQIQITIEKLFLEYKDLPAFRQSLQDFLVQIKVCLRPGPARHEGWVWFYLQL
jgi:exportin-1